MGQKANTITLKKNYENLNLLSYDSRSFIIILKYLRSFEFALRKKGVWISKKNMNFKSNLCLINLDLFFCSSKISYFKRKGIIKKGSKQLFLPRKKINNILSVFSKLRQNLFYFSSNNLNILVNRNTSILLYNSTKKFISTIFSRRFNLYIDFLKITSLFVNKDVGLDFFLYLLSQVFKVLSKKNHNRFIVFLKFLFKLITLNNKDIKGFKFVINGRISGKPRASSFSFQEGSVPNQSLDKNIYFSKQHVFTILGCFGFKLWVYRL